MAQEPNAILAINSLDRYQYNTGTLSQLTQGLVAKLYDIPPYPNNFQITSPGALIYGYLHKIVISQIQLQYNVPTIVPGKNDFFVMYQAGTVPGIAIAAIVIPFGFYTPQELAAVLQTLILASDFGISENAPNFTVTYDIEHNAFNFNSNNPAFLFYFPFQAELLVVNPTYTGEEILTIYRTYNLLGITITNSGTFIDGGLEEQISGASINFLYTPYIDIVSEVLTKYQNVKDTDSSAKKLNSIIARFYLSGVGIPQAVDGLPVGSRPFTVVQDLNSPKIMRWSPDEAVNSIDFQLRDQYGDLLFVRGPTSDVGNPVAGTYYTEFQMTLLCVEKNRY